MLLLPVAALVQPAPTPAPALPTWFQVPPGLEVKPGTLVYQDFDAEPMEFRNPTTAALVRVTAEGRVWRFSFQGEGTRMGALSMQERLKEVLALSRWNLVWPERGVSRLTVEGRDAWLRTQAGSGELKCVLVEKAPPPLILLPIPGPTPVMPKPQEDFPYLLPWPGAKISASAPSQSPVGVKLPSGEERMLLVNWVEKEYQLAAPISAHAFVVTYTAALTAAGWEIEGTNRGPMLQLQAFYLKEGRDLRATLRFAGDVMTIAVADVGAQLPKGK